MGIGDILKQRREECGLTQKELAEDICTQAMISRIEKNLVEPSHKLLEKIAKKLQVPSSYFYETNNPRTNLLSEIEERIRKHLNKSEYESILELVNTNIDIINNTTTQYYVVFFNWIKAILVYKLEGEAKQATSELKKIIQNDTDSVELMTDILSSLAIIYYEAQSYDEASKYFELALNKLNSKTSYKKEVKILYNYSLTLESLNQYKKAISCILEAIEILREHQSMYMLGYLYYHKAYLLSNLGQYIESIEAYENAYFVFRILNYEKMMLLTKIELKDVKDYYKKSDD